MKNQEKLTVKERYIENHLSTLKEYHEEGMKYLKWASKEIEQLEKINRSKKLR